MNSHSSFQVVLQDTSCICTSASRNNRNIAVPTEQLSDLLLTLLVTKFESCCCSVCTWQLFVLVSSATSHCECHHESWQLAESCRQD